MDNINESWVFPSVTIVGSSIMDVKKSCVVEQIEVTQDFHTGKVRPIETYSWQKLIAR